MPRDRVLLAGAGHESTRATIAAARRAAAGGADAVLIKTPSVYRAHVPPAGLVAHYTAVADASPVPVLLYNFPAFTGVNLSPDTVAQARRASQHHRHEGNEHRRRAVRGAAAAVPERFTVLCGAAPGVLAALCAGAQAPSSRSRR